MPRELTKKKRGIFEKEPGSGVWWIRSSSKAWSDVRKWAGVVTHLALWCAESGRTPIILSNSILLRTPGCGTASNIA